ncbi:aminotransferase class V-fold PLP-dependent enzyme [Chamaesiphon sp. VAR_48_metabat_135_sub]|uniref:aminotransferase class V-fold PLP-dependent enzyme n=1 Tax=Chamaesiphon sp. VAR_48_metabat_135_sub TaxID=2964699 RepID=UPI002869F76A|nr:aminotransferase class V-fold PLP-dependent enzyme [Chamaesiphon sp. VAR_48_metabat_135_sub]
MNRHQFPALTNKAYFNYGGQGPMPQAALDAILAGYQQIQSAGPFGLKTSELVVRESNLTRQAIALDLGVTAQSIALTENVTVGCNIALWGLDWQPGDRILLSDCEHPGVIASIQEICRRFQVIVDIFPIQATLNTGDPVAVVTAQLKPQTRLVVLSHVLWNTGQVLPLAEISAGIRQYPDADRQIRILVDAAQSVGLLPLKLDELGIDFYAFTGHKWWCGPEGVGGLYIHPNAMNSLAPTFIGWRSLDYSQPDLPLIGDARRYEVATSAYPLYAGLRAAIKIHQDWGSAIDRATKIVSLATYLWESLQRLPEIKCLNHTAPRSGLVSFQVGSRNHGKLVQSLEQAGFYLRTIVDPDCIRACTHYFTTTAEIDELVQCLTKLT